MNIQKKADIILSSNAVFTGLTNKPHPASIAIIDNKIAAISTEQEIEAYIGEQTKVYRYDNQLIMPGFHDFHMHIMFGSLAMNSISLFSARSEAEAVEMVLQYAEERPDDEWVIGMQWDSGYWDDQTLPHRSSLDRVLPDRPVLLFHADGHFAWGNSKALEMMGVDRNTKDPDFGEIKKDENGEPTGILIESATALITDGAFDFPQAKKEQLFQSFLQEAARLGVTSVNDLFATDTNKKLETYDLFQQFEKEGKLTTRVHLFPALDGDLDRAKQLREKYASDKLRVSGLKQFIDGVISSYTAYLIGPYADNPETCGHVAYSQESINEWVAAADKEGFSIRFHAIGDGAVRMALDAYEAAQKANGVRDSRHSVEHIEVIHPDDISRFNTLGVIASMQPGLLAITERGVYVSRIGEEREKYAFAINTLKEAGATLAFSTDFPIDALEPLKQIHRAVTRMDSSGKEPWNPQECLTLAETLKAYTKNCAYGTFREHEIGTLEAGKLADLVVLDRNLFEIPADEIADAKVQVTIMDGKIVFEESTESLSNKSPAF
jgi:predicted amidohydrolase YtcJ